MQVKRLCAATAAVCALAAGVAAAQNFPVKVIRVINPAQPGGNNDFLFRQLAPKMSEILGQPLVADYRPGASTIIGSELTARAAPDGYTMMVNGAVFVINPAFTDKLPFDPAKDFTPLGLIADLPAVLVAHPSLPVKNVKDLIALAKAQPGQIFYSSSGAGALAHLAGELLNTTVGIRLSHVPYKGAGRARLHRQQRLSPRRSGRHSAADRREAERRAGTGGARPRQPQDPDRARGRPCRQLDRGARRLHPRRDREVEAGGKDRRHQGGALGAARRR